MRDFTRRKLELPATDSPVRPGDFPIGSTQSRAAARSKLENLGCPVAPNLSFIFYKPGERTADGVGPPVKVDANHATIEGGNQPTIHVDRDPGESLEAFETRANKIMEQSRRRGRPRTALFEKIETPAPATQRTLPV